MGAASLGTLVGLAAWLTAFWCSPPSVASAVPAFPQSLPSALRSSHLGKQKAPPSVAAAPLFALRTRPLSAAGIFKETMQDAMEGIVGNIRTSIAAAAGSNKRLAITTPGGSQKAIPRMPGGLIQTPPPNGTSTAVPTVDLLESLMEAGFRSAMTGMAGILDGKVKEQQKLLEKQQADMMRCHEVATAANLKADQAKRDLEILRSNTSEAVTNNASSVEALVAKVSELQAEMQRMQLNNISAPPGLSAAPVGNSSRGSSSAAEREIPYEQRVHAVIGGLGWDSSGEDLLAKAKEVCAGIGLSELQLNSIVAIAGRNGGSTAELIFDSPALLTQARLKVRALNVSGLNGRKVFLDAKKTRRELQPARMTHRVCEAFTEMAGNHGGDITKIAKNLAKKSVSYDGTDVGQTVGGGWKWLPASSQWPPEQLQLIKEWAIEESG